MTRAERRHQMHRARKRAHRFFWLRKRQTPRLVGIAAQTPKPCSCYCCGNPRKYFNQPTIQERRTA